jgi:hypothetical protein
MSEAVLDTSFTMLMASKTTNKVVICVYLLGTKLVNCVVTCFAVFYLCICIVIGFI